MLVNKKRVDLQAIKDLSVEHHISDVLHDVHQQFLDLVNCNDRVIMKLGSCQIDIEFSKLFQRTASSQFYNRIF